MKTFRIIRNIFAVPIAALTLSYIGMCIYWICTGCRYGIRTCSIVFIRLLPWMLIASALGVMIVSVRSIRRIRSFKTALEHCRESGADEASEEELDRELERLSGDDEYKKLLKASAMLSCSAFEKCCAELDAIDFSALTPTEEEEYFNMLIYCLLVQGERRRAVETYLLCGHYFKRALARGGTQHIRHTVAMVYYAVGEYDKAERLLIEARMVSDKELRCDCDLYLALCFLRTGRLEAAKNAVISASAGATTSRQQQELEHLKKAVKSAFGRG